MGRGLDRREWIVEPLSRRHDRTAFSSGNELLDHYLRNHARQDARRNIAAPFVLVPRGGRRILGYYTLSAFAVAVDDLPDAVKRKLPRYPVVPATLLGRLAVDGSSRGRGLGEHLLVDALARALAQTDQIASHAVVVDAIDEAARRFYLHFDFLPLPSVPRRLFLPMASIARLFR